MGLHVGGIYVSVAPGVTRHAVREAVREYWLAIGAAPSAAEPHSFGPLELEKTGRLSYVVIPASPQEDGAQSWIALYDSERYRADPALARALAMRLKTQTWFYQVTESVNQAYAKSYCGAEGGREIVVSKFDDVLAFVATLPKPFLYFDELRSVRDEPWVAELDWLAFENVPYRKGAIYSGPSPAQLSSNDKAARAALLVELKDTKGLKALADDHQVLFGVISRAIEAADLRKSDEVAFVHALAEVVFDRNGHGALKIGEACLRAGDEALFERAVTQMAGGPEINLFRHRAVTLGQGGEHLLAFRMLEAVTRTGDVDQTGWANAIYFLIHVIADPGVPPAQLEALLEGAKRNAPTNPVIFHNLSCVYALMGRTEQVLDAIAGAVRYGYPKLEKLLAEAELEPLRDDPRLGAALATGTVRSIRHLVVARNGRTLVAPAIGLHLEFEGLAAAPAIAEVLADVQREFGEMFAYYRPASECTLRPAKKGKITRDLNELRKKSPEYGFDLQYDSSRGEACELRCEVSLDSKRPGRLRLHLPLALADDADALFHRLTRYVESLPFVCGHAGFATTVFNEGPVVGAGTDARAELGLLVPNYLGLSFSAEQLGESGAPGTVTPGWLTFLGEALAAKLAQAPPLGPARLRALGHSAVVIRAARCPIVGVRTGPTDVGALPQVVRHLGSVLRAPKGTYGELQRQRWEALRLLPDGSYEN